MSSTPYDRGNTDDSYKTAFFGAASVLLGLSGRGARASSRS